MPRYDYECPKCHDETSVFKSMDKCAEDVYCKKDGELMQRVWGCNATQLGFNEYYEDRFNGTPVLVKSPKHRDELYKKHGVTSDSVKFFRKPKPADIDIPFEQVVRAINEGQREDG